MTILNPSDKFQLLIWTGAKYVKSCLGSNPLKGGCPLLPNDKQWLTAALQTAILLTVARDRTLEEDKEIEL